jgi:hypothetical protein
MSLTGNLETARSMYVTEKIMLGFAYALLYCCGIVYLIAHWDLSGKKGKFMTEL